MTRPWALSPPAAAAPMSLSQLSRLLPAGRLAWKSAMHASRRHHPQPLPARGLCCSAAAAQEQLGPAAAAAAGAGSPAAAASATQTFEEPIDVRALPDFSQQPQQQLDGWGDPAAQQGAEAAAAGGAAGQGQGSRTGAFQRIPMVAPSKELLESALRRAARVGPNKKLKNEAQKAKNKAARQLDTLLKELCVPLGRYCKEFPQPGRLHPFERALLELSVGPGTYERVLGRVDALRKSTVQVGKAYAARCSKALNKREAVSLQEEGFTRLEAVFAKGAFAVDELKEVAKTLRKLPVVDPDLPTVALVGAPNVGKSSLVQLLSSGLPEVQNYPFTTRSIKMGHFYVDGRRHQVTDTPGLLNRDDEERNAMERLTLASLEHLPTAVLFVADLTGECGTTVADQWQIRRDLRSKFAGKPWLDVLSKADMLEEELDAADEMLEAQRAQQAQQAGSEAQQAQQAGGEAQQGAQLAQEAGSEAQQEGQAQQAQQQAVEQAAQQAQQALELEELESVGSAVDFAAALPGALRVSSLTGAGIEELKASMLTMLEAAQLERQGVEGWWEGEGEGGEGGEGEDDLIFHEDEEHRQHESFLYD